MVTESSDKITSYDLFLFAGEPSGDLHGAALIENLKALYPEIRIFGVGGTLMRKAGMDCVLKTENFSVMGFFSILPALPRFIRYFFSISRMILTKNPKGVVFIDYPGFALRLETRLKKKGYRGKIIHYICPSVWAHGKKRIASMEKSLSLLLSIFPFESRYFPPSFPILYVGNPLITRIRDRSYQDLGFPSEKKVIGIFPGSRKKEIEQNFPLQLKVLRRLLSEDPELVPALSLARPSLLPEIENLITKIFPEGLSLRIVPWEQAYDLMKACHISLAKSGTVTLELALHKVPTVVLYSIPPVDLFIAKNLLKISLPFYCIVNILADTQVFPELIGPNATEERIFTEAKQLLYDPDRHENTLQLCEEVANRLGTADAGLSAARAILSKLFGGIF